MIVTDLHSYEPKDGHGLAHDPFNAIIGPRPIGWIASQSPAGVRNLAPYSFFNALNYTPPILGFSSTGYKDSVQNIEQTREFVWNLTTRDLAEQMNRTSATVASGVDEFTLAGLTPVNSVQVKAARVGESRVAMECILTEILQLKNASGESLQTWLVLGEVVRVHIDRSLIKEGVYQTAEAHPVLRAGGPGSYAEIRPDAMFDMLRPR